MDYKAIFDKFSNYKILVIGDVMLDDYIVGSVSRISPEAPVPVVDIAQRYARLGGAANVAFNIKAMGSTAILCSVVGTCKKSDTFIQLLQKENMPIDGIVRSQDRKMTVKYRVLGNNVQLLRMDDEEKDELSLQDRQALLAKIKHYISTEKNIAIVFEDYDKGVISSALIDEVVAMAQQYQVPITVDPKKRNFLHYHHIDIFKPNRLEAEFFAGIEIKDIYEKTGKLPVPYRYDGEKLIYDLKLNSDGSFDEACADYWVGEAVKNIKKIRHYNPGACIIWALGMLGNGLKPLVERTISEYRAETGDERITFLELKECNDETVGSRCHPGIKNHMEAAETISVKIKEVL